MSDWAWVGFAYATVYLTLLVYTAFLLRHGRRIDDGGGSH